MIANKPIEVGLLPNGALALEKLVQGVSGEALPCVNYLAYGSRILWRAYYVHMIRHHDPTQLVVALAIEMLQGVTDDSRGGWFSQQALTVPVIQPPFDRAGKSLMILALNFTGPWFGMVAEPSRSLELPTPEKFCRERICQSKRDEINSAALFPVREAILRSARGSSGTEELEVHPGPKR